MTKFERIDEFKSIISNFETGDAQVVRYYYETSSIERTKSDTGSVGTYVRRGFFLRQAPRGKTETRLRGKIRSRFSEKNDFLS